MERFFEFIGNHWILSSSFAALVVAYFWSEGSRSGKSVGPQALSILVNREKARVIDVRDLAEFRAGHITGSEHVSLSQFKDYVAKFAADKETPIVVVCGMGHAAGSACAQLTAAGLKAVYKLDGGISRWKTDGLPLVKK